MAGLTANISVSTCRGAEWCGERWCHRWSMSGRGLMGNISPHGPGLSSHMPWRCMCVSKFIHFNLSNTTSTEGAIHYFAAFHLSLTHTHTAEVWTEGTFSLSELCEQMFCVFEPASVCMYMRVYVTDSELKRKGASFGGRLKRMCRLRSHHMLKIQPDHLKGLPSTASPLRFIMTLFLTAAKGEDQSVWDRGRRQKKVTGNEYRVKSLSSSESIVSGT